MAVIEQESLDKTGLRSDVITLFGGAKYHLYRYKKYTDVRLVWAPESSAAFFGGDMDNFEYPRYNMDVTMFRVYEDGKPAKIDHFLEWSEDGAGDGELVFVSGNPARTDRGLTTAALKTLATTRSPSISIICAGWRSRFSSSVIKALSISGGGRMNCLAYRTVARQSQGCSWDCKTHSFLPKRRSRKTNSLKI